MRDLFWDPFIDDIIDVGRSQVWVIDITPDKTIIFLAFNGIKDQLSVGMLDREGWRHFWDEYWSIYINEEEEL